MNIFITTDTHFGHDKMIEFCGRPRNFEEIIKKKILKVVLAGDLFIHLGDICIGNDEIHNKWFTENIKCKKILVKGNHDKKSNSWYLSRGWDFVCESFSDKFFGKRVLFSHAPQKSNNFDINIHGHFHNALPRLLNGDWKIDGEKERNEQDLINFLTEGKHYNISLEENNYNIVNLINIVK
jgi:calcineurin-like phosphoesterase family protein